MTAKNTGQPAPLAEVSSSEIVSWQPSNREKAHESKTGTFWCDHCDAQRVHDGEKCRNCGKRNRRRGLKKYIAAS